MTTITLTTLILRLIVVFFMLACARECWHTTRLVANRRLKTIVKRITVGVFAFALFRLVATFLDAQIAFAVGVFSNIVNYGFWCWIWFYLHKNRKRIESDAVGAAGRQRLSSAIEEIIVEMKLEREQLTSQS